MSRFLIPFENLNLDLSGVAGNFGGDEAVQAVKTIHLYKARRWTGWYNAPGSSDIAKCLGPIANSRFWNAIFSGHHKCLETVFGLDKQSGPKYIASHSDTIIDKTPHVAYLVTQKIKKENIPVITVGNRIMQPMTLTVVKVREMPKSSAQAESNGLPTITLNIQSHHSVWLATIPISASLAACALCVYICDWYSLAVIFLGIMANGLTCLVVGSASIVLEGVNTAAEAPPGDGMLVDDRSNHIVILQGEEKDVNWIIKGRFHLEYPPRMWMKKRHSETESTSGVPMSANVDLERMPDQQTEQSTKGTPGHKEYRGIGICSLLLDMQSLLQVLLIPQGTLFGQEVFLLSFIISWVYNLYLTSLDKEKVQQELLFKTLDVKPTSRFELRTRTTAAVFATLVLRPLPQEQPSSVPPSIEPQPYCPIELLKCLVPSEKLVWKKWRQHVGKHIERTSWTGDRRDEVASLGEPDTTGLSRKDRTLLGDLLTEAQNACEAYYDYLKEQASENLSSNYGVGRSESFRSQLGLDDSRDSLLSTISMSGSGITQISAQSAHGDIEEID